MGPWWYRTFRQLVNPLREGEEGGRVPFPRTVNKSADCWGGRRRLGRRLGKE